MNLFLLLQEIFQGFPIPNEERTSTQVLQGNMKPKMSINLPYIREHEFYMRGSLGAH
ncbi:hypothetical protein RchiOBHm_Chr6g0278151 [Rosa chinensis]|uniref:Uncharacterized protein n=1 Tax=Rosa chinensis TaxID=74649 RepID=A0A2P6PSR2_ROSCH|nr:hypothetical protein RchiOBHm_Chr6g0278151 [Rosa chinensis]